MDDVSNGLHNQHNVNCEDGSSTINSLYLKWKSNQLNLRPEYQRNFVWGREKASKLVESVLLHYPLPMLYFYERPEGGYNVIDGQQRLTSLFAFKDGKIPLDVKWLHTEPFALKGVGKKYNGLTYSTLGSDDRILFDAYILNYVSITNTSNPNIVYDLYERLNTKARTLTSMELRNCIYRGEYNNLIYKLSTLDDFKFITRFPENQINQMKDREAVLMFGAFYHMGEKTFEFNAMKDFMDDDMDRINKNFITDPIDSDKDLKDIEKCFKQAIKNIKQIFGEKAFRVHMRGNEHKKDGKKSRKMSMQLYDAYMRVFYNIPSGSVVKHSDALREALIDLEATNDVFIESLGQQTFSVISPYTKIRYDIVKKLVNDILGDDIKHQPRIFKTSLKEELYKKNKECAICGNSILSIDDSSVDHIEQYWMGGKTIPENARLSHKYCNYSRLKNDIIKMG